MAIRSGVGTSIGMAPPWPGQGGHFYRVMTGHFYCRSTAHASGIVGLRETQEIPRETRGQEFHLRKLRGRTAEEGKAMHVAGVKWSGSRNAVSAEVVC